MYCNSIKKLILTRCCGNSSFLECFPPQRSAQAVEEDSEKICTKLLRSIERKHVEVKELLRAEERAALAQAEVLLERLDQQTEDTRRTEAELELLSRTDDHIHFLLVNFLLS